MEKLVDGVTKQFIKDERLKYYPRGMNLYSSSRGMKKPVVEELTNKEVMARVGDAKLVYRETYSIGADKKGNLVDKRYYKKVEKAVICFGILFRMAVFKRHMYWMQTETYRMITSMMRLVNVSQDRKTSRTV